MATLIETSEIDWMRIGFKRHHYRIFFFFYNDRSFRLERNLLLTKRFLRVELRYESNLIKYRLVALTRLMRNYSRSILVKLIQCL